jgi:hypothetical protein
MLVKHLTLSNVTLTEISPSSPSLHVHGFMGIAALKNQGSNCGWTASKTSATDEDIMKQGEGKKYG